MDLWGFLLFFDADGLTPIKEKRTKSTAIQGFAAGSDNSHYPTASYIDVQLYSAKSRVVLPLTVCGKQNITLWCTDFFLICDGDSAILIAV